jgi:hypothetical protein
LGTADPAKCPQENENKTGSYKPRRPGIGCATRLFHPKSLLELEASGESHADAESKTQAIRKPSTAD